EIRRQTFRCIPAAAFRDGIRGHGHRAGQRPAHHHPTRRTDLGRKYAWPGQHILFLTTAFQPQLQLLLKSLPGTLRPVLLAEDNANDIELILSAFQEAGLANEIVVTRDGHAAMDY